jgi:hypothetical protein
MHVIFFYIFFFLKFIFLIIVLPFKTKARCKVKLDVITLQEVINIRKFIAYYRTKEKKKKEKKREIK